MHMTTPHDIFHSMSFDGHNVMHPSRLRYINTTKLHNSPSLYLEYVHVVPKCCCEGYARSYAAPKRSMAMYM